MTCHEVSSGYDEQILVEARIHSPRRAMEEVGVEEPGLEFERMIREEEILKDD